MLSLRKVQAEMELLEAVVRQAMLDFGEGCNTRHYTSAASFLHEAGPVGHAQTAIA